jgi:hypothetical protein
LAVQLYFYLPVVKKAAFILLFLGLNLLANSQFVFQTFFKKGAVAVGEPFRIQYVLEDRSDIEFFPPDFSGFRMVNQPSVYGGVTYGAGEPTNLKNIIFTLEAINPGKYTISGATARKGNQLEKSDDVIVEVITKAEATMRSMQARARESNNAAYFLAPGEDPREKIKRNLFLKVLVDKKNCFVGEPVTATFKLYSRLISRSDIVKNPGFYGFTVQDVIGLNDNHSAIETINGNKFDVHTVRKVQLYPLQEGQYTIDPMEVVTKVDFSRSVVYKKTEQEIKEGVFAEEEVSPKKGVETYETTMSSGTIPIIVKPVPAKNKPADYYGATGNFSISASFNKKEIGKNEQGELVVTVSGKGNFTQLASPVINWPKGVEVFDARIKDELNHSYSPMKGKRTFHIPFLSVRPGTFTVPPIHFSFFDPDSNRYKTTLTQPAVVSVSTNEKPLEKAIENKNSIAHDYTGTMLAFLLLLVVAIGAGILWRRKLQEARAQKLVVNKEPLPPTVAELLKPAYDHLNDGSKEFYTVFRQCIWNFFSIYLGLKGSSMSRYGLVMAMNEKAVETSIQQTILEILEDCETGIFADVDIQGDKKGILEIATLVLENIQKTATAGIQ